MRVLLDENFPLPLVKDFAGHDCSHVITLGWAGILNGELLAKSEAAGYEVLITFDDGIPKDHDITTRKIAIFIVQPEGQGVSQTRNLIPEILEALKTCGHGQVSNFTNRTRKRGP